MKNVENALRGRLRDSPFGGSEYQPAYGNVPATLLLFVGRLVTSLRGWAGTPSTNWTHGVSASKTAGPEKFPHSRCTTSITWIDASWDAVDGARGWITRFPLPVQFTPRMWDGQQSSSAAARAITEARWSTDGSREGRGGGLRRESRLEREVLDDPWELGVIDPSTLSAGLTSWRLCILTLFRFHKVISKPGELRDDRPKRQLPQNFYNIFSSVSLEMSQKLSEAINDQKTC
ncbi:hypothetical protein B0H13DRAFT_1886378 [Mycena leptocephala]|nr:hypothetical protein B0H13DRAFT_1886378 [Mycena leptocephala]